MDARDQQAIETLFERLTEVERRSPPRDPEAEAFIRSAIAGQPAAPYYMAQTVIVQQQALEEAERRIEELERGSGGLFGGLFGDARRAPVDNRRAAARAPGPWGGDRGGGGFLAGAAQTAMGVAGGVLLGNLIGGMLFGGPAEAQESGNDNSGDDNADAADAGDSGDAGGDFDGGFDF